MTLTPQKTHEGKVVNVVGDKLKTVCDKGNEHCYTVTKDTKVTCNGQPSNTADLKSGTDVLVTTRSNDIKTATAVDSGKHITGPVPASKA